MPRELLAWVGLAGKARLAAGALAYTDQRRLSIARAMMLSPAFVLLDEPAAGMSDAECEELMVLVSVIPKTFTCGVLLIEHNMRVVMGISAPHPRARRAADARRGHAGRGDPAQRGRDGGLSRDGGLMSALV